MDIITDNNSSGDGMDISFGSAQEMDLTSGGGEVIDPKIVAQAITDGVASDKEIEETKDAEVAMETDGIQIINDKSLNEKEDKEEAESKDAPVAKDKASKELEEEGETETFKVLAQHFSDEGILDGYDEDMENTPEALQDMVSNTVQKGIDEYKDSFVNPLSKQFLDYIENNGDPGQFMKLVNGPDYQQLSSEALGQNEGMQKQVLRAYYAEQGESQEDIEETIQAFEDAGNLDKRSNVALGKLQKMQANKIQEGVQQQQAAKAAEVENINKYIETLETDIKGREDIAGFDVSKKTKQDFFDYITKVDPKTGTTRLLTDSQDQEKQLKMSFFYFNDFNFNKLEKKAKSNGTKDLMAKLGRHTDTSKKQTTTRRTPVQDAEKNDLSALKSMFG